MVELTDLMMVGKPFQDGAYLFRKCDVDVKNSIFVLTNGNEEGGDYMHILIICEWEEDCEWVVSKRKEI